MTDEDGFRIEAAEQFGFTPTEGDTDGYICTETQLIAFAKACERKGLAIAYGIGSRDLLYQHILKVDAELTPILAAEEERAMNAAGYVRGTDEPGKRWVKPSREPTQISDECCDLAAVEPCVDCPRDECVRRGIDPDEICADGGVTAEMVVASDAGCGQAVTTPWQTPAPCGGQVGSTWLALDPLRNQIMRLIREEFDPTPPNWEGREWNDNAEDTADKILAAVRIAMRSEVVRKELL